MKPAESIVVGAIALAVLGGGAFFLLSGSDPNPGGTGEVLETRPVRTETHASPATPAVAELAKASSEQSRKPVEPGLPSDVPQGFTGTVVESGGVPVANAAVYLVHGFQPLDLFALLAQARNGRMFRRVESETRTNQAGAFKLPCLVYSQMQPFEIVVEHASLVTSDKKADLRVAENIYRDVGRIVMKAGNTIQGSVMVAGAPVPIAGAVVRLRQGNNPFFARMPGSEGAVEARTNAAGRYEFKNVEAGAVELEAAAKGYAMEVRSGILVQDGQAQGEQGFELQKGYEIAGVVTDAEGKPIPQARVVADAISTKARVQVTSIAGRDGSFEILGLLEGQYVVAADADGFVHNDRKPVAAGDRGVQIALEKQGGVRVIVTGKNGQLLSRYTVELKSWFEGQPDNFGRVPDKPPVPGKPARNGEFLLEGINPGTYVLQVEAPLHAKKFSEHFAVAAGGEPPVVRVQLGQGGVILGQILGANGRPLPGVTVSTMPNDLDENPFTNLIGGLVPKKISETSAATGADGRFRLTLLLPDKYQLRISHPEHYRMNKKGIEVAEGLETDLGAVQLAAGIRVSGAVYVNGAPEPAAEVSISGTGGGALFSEKALTNDQGQFKIGVPLPPGKYEATARRTRLSNVFGQIIDHQKSKKEITFLEGATSGEVILEINDTAPPPGIVNPSGTAK